MVILVQHHTKVSKQTTLLDGVAVGLSEWCVCGRGLNRFVHEGMKDISNVKVNLKTRSGNVNIFLQTLQDIANMFVYIEKYASR